MVIYPNSPKTNDMSTQLVIKIAATSNWQRLYSCGFLMMVLLIISMTAIPIYGVLAVLMVGVLLCLLIEKNRGAQPLHITGCNIDEVNGYWQLLTQGRHQPILWQAKLMSTQSFAHCVQLIFDTEQPRQQRETILIWKDQVEADTWRKLKVLTRWG